MRLLVPFDAKPTLVFVVLNLENVSMKPQTLEHELFKGCYLTPTSPLKILHSICLSCLQPLGAGKKKFLFQ